MTVTSWVFIAFAVYTAGQLLNVVGTLHVPDMVNWIGVVVAGYLGYRGMQLSR
ncbi:MAG TPA: hypothetical protein VEK36_02255 [Candidatus Paceibacterota bacterium]|nr:hypothetical protein [Candidatus Paceibacterota bacterium]